MEVDSHSFAGRVRSYVPLKHQPHYQPYAEPDTPPPPHHRQPELALEGVVAGQHLARPVKALVAPLFARRSAPGY